MAGFRLIFRIRQQWERKKIESFKKSSLHFSLLVTISPHPLFSLVAFNFFYFSFLTAGHLLTVSFLLTF